MMFQGMEKKLSEEVLKFWLIECNHEQWFKKDLKFDAKLKRKFLSIYNSACSGKLHSWRLEPRPCLALIICLDQFSRNFFRQDKRAFEQDEKAQELCWHAIKNNYLDKFEVNARMFSLLPLIHSEKIEDHEAAQKMLEKYLVLHPRHDSIKEFWMHHSNAIRRFGRYPHRNFILGRTSTQEETTFLKGPNSSW